MNGVLAFDIIFMLVIGVPLIITDAIGSSVIIGYIIGCVFSFIFCIIGLICELKHELKFNNVECTIGDIFSEILLLISCTLLSWGIIIWFLYENREKPILYFKKRNYHD